AFARVDGVRAVALVGGNQEAGAGAGARERETLDVGDEVTAGAGRIDEHAGRVRAGRIDSRLGGKLPDADVFLANVEIPQHVFDHPVRGLRVQLAQVAYLRRVDQPGAVVEQFPLLDLAGLRINEVI